MYLYAKDCEELYCSESYQMQETWIGRQGRRAVIPSAETARVTFKLCCYLLKPFYLLSLWACTFSSRDQVALHSLQPRFQLHRMVNPHHHGFWPRNPVLLSSGTYLHISPHLSFLNCFLFLFLFHAISSVSSRSTFIKTTGASRQLTFSLGELCDASCKPFGVRVLEMAWRMFLFLSCLPPEVTQKGLAAIAFSP